MANEKEKTLILVISPAHKAWGESVLLHYCIKKNSFEDIALSDYKNYWNKFNKKKFYFALVEQSKWYHYKNKIEEVTPQYNKVIVWSHETNGVSCEIIKKSLNTNKIECFPFTHEGADREPRRSLKELMMAIGKLSRCSNMKSNKNLKMHINKNCENIAENLIRESLKQSIPYLIALSILCQGYLAAHGGNGLKGWDGLSFDLKEAAKLNWPNVKNDWWEPVFGTETSFEKTGVYNELQAMGKECKDADAIKNLFKAIRKSNGNDFTGTVVTANACIKEILKGK